LYSGINQTSRRPSSHPAAGQQQKGGEEMAIRTIETSKERGIVTTALCPRCRFHPASPRLGGYCSWDCYELDGDDAEDEEDSDKAA
jgi:hypothetical protein